MDKIPNISVDEIHPINKKCAPTVEFIDGSCLNMMQLSMMVDEYNLRSSDAILINKKFETLYPREYKIYLLYELQERLGDNQAEWIANKAFKNIKDDVMETIQRYTFLPRGPSGKFEWLSNFDINDVMERYMKKYKDYKWLGAVPVDFEEYVDEFRRLNLAEYEAIGKHRFGIIINMDKHNQPGSHWVALFFDLTKGHVYYIDSVGIEPPKLVSEFMQKINKYLKSKGIQDTDIRHNNIQNQKGNSECGVYSIRAILKLLKNGDFDKFKSKVVRDKEANKCRKKLFNLPDDE